MSVEFQKFIDFLEKNKILEEYLSTQSTDEAYLLLKNSGYEFSFEEFSQTWSLLQKKLEEETSISS